MAWKSSAALTALLAVASFCLTSTQADPGDYPGWRGADRSGVSPDTGLLKEWPKGGPALLWKASGIGGGYATPSVSDGRVFVLGSKNNEEYLFALAGKDGKQLWSVKAGAVGRNVGQQWPGPRSTPTVDGDFVYTLSSDGDLMCAQTADGKAVWRKHLRKDLGGSMGKWAYAESPLIDGDVLVCTPGGASATMVALEKKTGNVIWKCAMPGGSSAAYASPIIAEAGGVKQYVNLLSGSLVGVSAKDGKLLWTWSGSANTIANIPTPLHHDGHVFSATGYGKGGGLVKLTAEGDSVSAKEVYRSSRLENKIGGFVRVGDYLYGLTSRQLVCIDFKTGQEKWAESVGGPGSVAAADGHLYIRLERGTVILAEATPAGYKEKGRFEQPDHGRTAAWPYPVIANGRLYLRDGDVLLCYDVKMK